MPFKKGQKAWNKGLTKKTSEALQVVSDKLKDHMEENHMSKTNPEKWKKQCKEHSERMTGKNNPMYENTHTKEARKKISESRIGHVGYWKGKKFPPEARKLMRENHANFSGKNHPMYGKHLSHETKKKISESKKGKYVGELSPRWKGGISYEPYCSLWSDKEYKESIKERDGHKCLNPSCSKEHELLHLHHINYNKKDCNPKNIITLCVSCNGKANVDRGWHKAWYKAIIYQRYKI